MIGQLKLRWKRFLPSLIGIDLHISGYNLIHVLSERFYDDQITGTFPGIEVTFSLQRQRVVFTFCR